MTQRIINNKHYADSSLITPDKFLSHGEIIISNEYGFEGIYVLNTNGEAVRIGYRKGSQPSSGSTDSGSTVDPDVDYVDAEFVKNYLKAQAYMTSAKTAEMLSVLESVFASLSGDYATHKAQNIVDFNAVNRRIDELSGFTPSSGSGGYDPTVINDINSRISILSSTTEDHIAQSINDFQTLNERIDELSGMTIEVVTDEHIREIAAQEVAKLVSSADSMYQTLMELADWVENDTSGSAQLINDVAELKDVVSGHTNDIASLNDRVDGIEEMIENLPSGSTPSSGSTIDEDTLNALKAYIDEQIRNISIESDHVFLSRGQYRELIANGRVEINGVMHYYSDDIYYCLYADGTPDTGDSSYHYDEETGMIETSGNTEVSDGILELASAELDDDGFVTLTEGSGPTPDVEPEIDDEGLVDVSSLPVDEEGLVELPDGWEII